FAIIHVTTPLVVAIKWNNERTEGVIPEIVIERISERFDQPGSRYSWDSPVFEVDMEHYEPDYVVPEIVEILDGLKPAKKPEHSPRTETQFEALDVETRRVVAEFLLEHPSLRNNEEVSVTRRDFLRKASEEEIPVRNVQKELWAELLKLL
ncbi:MAG: hypothetical protein ACFFCP_00755, partial [Promethearchaeota archaeon]